MKAQREQQHPPRNNKAPIPHKSAPSAPNVAAVHQHVSRQPRDSLLLQAGANPRNTSLIVEIDDHHTQREDVGFNNNNNKKGVSATTDTPLIVEIDDHHNTQREHVGFNNHNNNDQEGVASTTDTSGTAQTFTGLPPHARMQEYTALQGTEHASSAFSANITNIIKALG